MAVTNTREIVDSYIGLLIMQYLSMPKAIGCINNTVSPVLIPQTSVQTVTFSAAPTSGTFTLSYNGSAVAAINWNDSAAAIQAKLQAVTALAAVTVAGTIASGTLSMTFTGVPAPAYVLLLTANSLAPAVVVSVAETDQTIPLAVQNAFNLISGTTLASGTQLDTLGNYAGVTRAGFGFSGQPITLNDTEFYQLIQMAITQNSSGSSLATIQDFLQRFFPSEIYVFDHADMTMTYVISAGAVSADLVALFVTEGLLPSPMGVMTSSIIYVPTAHLFSFRTYELANTVGSPFNTYSSYSLTAPWLSYANVI